jgi:4-aminobutyrate aminotransferase/(S)-3-amino-2-methylpropionate transaminase
MALTGRAAPYKHGLNLPNTDIYRVPFPLAHGGVDVAHTLGAIDQLFRCDVEPQRVAAIIIEPVQGEGGFHVAPPELLRELRTLCDRHGIVLIADEIQAGFGRTGRMFAIEHSGVEPDLVTLAKSLAGGFPLSAVLGKQDIMDRVEPGGLGGTYGGSPIGCAAALAVLDVFESQHLPERAREIGAVIQSRIQKMATRSDLRPIAHVRGLGAMIGFDLVQARGSDAPESGAGKKVTQRALGQGLVVLSCGALSETVRILVPLTVSDAVLNEGLTALERALAND